MSAGNECKIIWLYWTNNLSDKINSIQFTRLEWENQGGE
jgi:hypothetical protein